MAFGDDQNQPNPGNLIAQPAPVEPVTTQTAIPELAQIQQKPLAMATDIGAEEKQFTDKAVTDQAWAHLIAAKNEMVNGSNGVVYKKGQDAFNLLATMQPAWSSVVKSFNDGLTPQQQRMMSPAIQNETTEFESLVKTHESEERHNFYLTSSQNLQKNLQMDAITNYSAAGPNKVEQSITGQLAELKTQGKMLGWSPEELEAKARETINQTHDGIIERLLGSNQYPQAQAYFDQYSHEITGAYKADIVSKLRQGAVSQASIDLEKQFGTTFALPGGGVDVNKIDRVVLANPNFSDTEKKQIQDNVKAEARNQILGNQQLKQANNEAFMSAAVKARQSNVPLSQALASLIPKFSNGNKYDAEVMAKQINDFYGPVKESDPMIYSTFAAQAKTGTLDRVGLDKAFKEDDTISLADYNRLTGEGTKKLTQGITADDKHADTVINGMMKDYFTDTSVAGQREKGQFEIWLDGKTEAMTPEDKINFAAAAMKDGGETNPYKGLNIDWKSDLAKQTTNNAQMGDMVTNLGSKAVIALTQEIQKSKPAGAKITSSDLTDFIQTLGGPQVVTPGTPYFNAIQTMADNGYAINSTNMALLLNKYPTGKP